ncbi:MAG TPA: hypothetical protein VF020_11990 [Chthoniobacterales bacterium]
MFHILSNERFSGIFVAKVVDLSIHVFQEVRVIVRFDRMKQLDN